MLTINKCNNFHKSAWRRKTEPICDHTQRLKIILIVTVGNNFYKEAMESIRVPKEVVDNAVENTKIAKPSFLR